MKLSFLFLIVLAFSISAFAQGEQAPIVEKDIVYSDWNYKDIRSGDSVNLRKLVTGKKLVMVAYFSPWCPNWKANAPVVQRLYDKYKGDGFAVVGVGLYDPVDSMKSNLDALKINFPAVYESDKRDARLTSQHYTYRTSVGDIRKWGSPWYIFLSPSMMEKSGDALTKKAFVVNGEIIAAEAEKFIAERLGTSKR